MATAFPEKKDIGCTTSEIANKAQEFGNTVGQKMSDAASFVGQKAEDAAQRMGAGMKSLGGTVREHAPHSGMAGSASSAVADSLERSGRYLEERGLGGICTDLTNVIRRNPIPSLLIGIGAGFLLARATSRR
jgi:hypothetical protein